MKILLCNPSNTQGSLHSRKGMYVPLGILSLATYLEQNHGKDVEISVVDEDVDILDINILDQFDLVGFYATTFNYTQAVRYAYFAKSTGCITVLGGPHATVLADNILHRRNCFDYVFRYEAEFPFAALLARLLKKTAEPLEAIPNICFRKGNEIFISPENRVNNLADLPIPSRKFINFERYIENYHSVYSDSTHIRPGSIYSSKGCSWRDKTGGCIFCARLEEGVRFRTIKQLWSEVEMLQSEYGVNSIWDISDDNLNNPDWFKEFVKQRPASLQDVRFFIYSRVNTVKPWVIDYFNELNVEEVFLGVESGDNRLLKRSFKGQTREIALKALQLLNDNHITFYPSFVLGLPGENEESLGNTLSMCEEISEMGGLDRMSVTILKPTPGCAAFFKLINETSLGPDLAKMDEIDLPFLEKYWVKHFVDTSYETVLEYKQHIDEIMSKKYKVFGSASSIEDEIEVGGGPGSC